MRAFGIAAILTVLGLNDSTQSARVTNSACTTAPFGNDRLYLRGSMSGWAAAEEYALSWHCDGYVIVTELQGSQEFKIGDAAWSDRSTFAAPQGEGSVKNNIAIARVKEGGVQNIRYRFDGWQSVRLAFNDGRPHLTIEKVMPPAATVLNPVALSLSHDTRALADKAPFGAAPAGTAMTFALNALPGIGRATLHVETRRLEGNQELLEYREVARVPLLQTKSDKRDRWTASYDFRGRGVYGYWFEVEIGNRSYVYGNNGAPIYWTRERGANGLGRVDVLPADRSTIRRFRQTVYSANFEVPSWAQDAIYYYIFPERFRNGDANNDSRPGLRTFQDDSVERHANWSDKPYRPRSGDGSDDRYSNDFFGGDLQGIIEKLDYIARLGANTIYMTPIFKAASNHKYDTGDYTEIDPAFGTNVDFQRLTAEARQRGIRVIIDASFNHTGRDSLYFDRYGKYPTVGALEGGEVRRDSPYASWYRLDPTKQNPEDRYAGWTGAKDLPEINKTSQSFRSFVYGAPGSVTRTWLGRGASGWRMDVAPWVPDDFWQEWRQAVKASKPDALAIAETWFDASKYFLGDEFDGTMNYIFRDAVIDIAAGGNAAADYRNIELTRELYPPQSLRASMNLLSTHDTARTLWLLGDRGDNEARTAVAKRRYRLALFVQSTWPGAPTVFYGDEVGMTGGEDPDNRRTYPWADLGGHPDKTMLAEFRQLLTLRKNNPILAQGTLSAPLFADAHIIAVLRQLDDGFAVTAFNNADSARTVAVQLPASFAGRRLTDAITGRTFPISGDGRVSVEVPALFGSVLIGH